MENNQQDPSATDLLDELDELDKIFIRLKLEGKKDFEIAKETGKHRETVANRLKKVKVQRALKELGKSAIDILLSLQSAAAREMGRQLKEGKTDRDKREAAKEILKGVLSERFTIDTETQRKIKEYLDEDDFDHIVEEHEE